MTLNPPQAQVFRSFLRVTFLPEYSKPENNFFVFNKHNGARPPLCINHGTGFIKNISTEVSVCVKLVEKSRQLTEDTMKFNHITDNFNEKIEAHLRKYIDEADLKNIVALCDIHGTTVRGITVY